MKLTKCKSLTATLLVFALAQSAIATVLFQGFSTTEGGLELGNDGVIRQQMSQREMQLEAQSDAWIKLPTNTVSTALVVRSETTMKNAFASHAGASSPTGWAAADSGVSGGGAFTNEAGLTLERLFGSTTNPYQLESAFKAHRADLYSYQRINQPFTKSTVQAPMSFKEKQGFNIDTRLSRSFGDLNMALRVENLFPNRSPGMVASPYTLKAYAEMATDFRYAGVPTQLNFNLERFEALEEHQDARYAGAELQWGRLNQTRLRLGYRHDLIANLDSVASLGLVMPLFNVFDLDISGTKNPGTAYGILARLAAPF